MVGGSIIGWSYRVSDDTTNINVRGTGCEAGAERTVRVRGEHKLAIGDPVWWQGVHVLWTSMEGEFVDRQLERAFN